MINKLASPISEREITDEWIHSDITYISIICCTYNQENYISDAINSFLAQKTKYKFEIIIHDDRSTDKTSEIITSFKNKFPNIIKVIKPEENLYSKYGVNAPGLNAISQSSGKYIAFCEGDDFWIDAYKLEKQYSTMIKYDTNFSFHRAKKLNGKDINIGFDYGDNILSVNIKKIFSTNQQFSPTSSYMIKREVIYTLPDWFPHSVIGDFFLETYSMKEKNGLYLPDIMSIYRENAINSWTQNNSDVNKKININKKIIQFLTLSKLDFNQEVNSLLNNKISHLYFLIANLYLNKKDFENFKKYIQLSIETSENFNIKYFLCNLFKETPYIITILFKMKKFFNRFI